MVTDSATYLSAVAALVGTFVGGITSIATSWLGQQRQTKEQRRAQAKAEMPDDDEGRMIEIVSRPK